ncbi:tryptophan synthase subunit beta [Sulfitobacter sp. D7]|uniref:tryptophan synthase subunit beta n=1 Tax=Sulfitobacter sp. D7 TaxID=1968541 RepID=UPI000E77B078|nr:tryptophan synthase subunit beta [Sulfitobacter sp. D7]AYE85570.1 tryptophan synthase subunit beta [Sulfitobacter sp. D7]
MKNAFATASLILATAGTAAFAQGMEGQRIGYNDETDNGVSYSSRSEAVDEAKLENFKDGILRAEDLSDVTITVFPTAQSDASVNRFPR